MAQRLLVIDPIEAGPGSKNPDGFDQLDPRTSQLLFTHDHSLSDSKRAMAFIGIGRLIASATDPALFICSCLDLLNPKYTRKPIKKNAGERDLRMREQDNYAVHRGYFAAS